MFPFSEFMYPDTIRIKRAGYEKRGTKNVVIHGEPEPPEMASVQTETVQRFDPQTGRITTKTMHKVRTPTNRHLTTNDQILWTDKSGQARVLSVEGPSTPKGIGDVQYKAECDEIL